MSLAPLSELLPSSPMSVYLPYAIRTAFLGLVIAAMERRVHRLRRPRERTFWHEVSGALVCALVALLAEGLLLSVNSSAATSMLLSALSFGPVVVLICAVESSPDRDDRPSVVGPQDKLTRLAILCFLLFFVAYFDLAPRQTTGRSEVLPGLVLHFGLYLFLILRLWYRVYHLRSPRWRQLYLYTSFAVLPPMLFQMLAILNHGSDLAHYLPGGTVMQDGLVLQSSMYLSPLLAVSYLLWVITAEIRFLDLPAPQPPRSLPKPVVYGTSSSFFILLWALALPCVHLIFYGLGWLSEGRLSEGRLSQGRLSEEHLQSRQGIVTLGLIILGGISLRQHWIVRQSSNELLMRRARAESALRKSEASVRLTMQRQVSAKELKEADERFAKFFRSSPNALLISTVDEGKVMETNEHFETLSGYDRSSLVGKTVADLKLWLKDDVQASLINALRQGKLRNRQMELRHKDGEIRAVLLSAEPLDLAGHECILAVLRDISSQEHSRSLLKERNIWRRHIENQRRLRRWPRRRDVATPQPSDAPKP